jgi:hypothetical protein
MAAGGKDAKPGFRLGSRTPLRTGGGRNDVALSWASHFARWGSPR